MTTTANTPRVITGITALQALVGENLGCSDWLEITQDRVNQFADATGDHQWIHVDVVRAKAESPFGGPIAHGYLTLSIGPMLAPQIMTLEGFSMMVNYGCGKVRFPSPVPVGSKLRLEIELQELSTWKPGQALATFLYTFKVQGTIKPACVAEVIVLILE